MTAITSVTTMIGYGPAHHGGADFAPTPCRDFTFRIEQTELGRDREYRRRQRQAAATITTKAMAHGIPMVWKYGSLVAVRHRQAPTIVRPEPRMTCATPL